jgi:hypothetical protein
MPAPTAEQLAQEQVVLDKLIALGVETAFDAQMTALKALRLTQPEAKMYDVDGPFEMAAFSMKLSSLVWMDRNRFNQPVTPEEFVADCKARGVIPVRK